MYDKWKSRGLKNEDAPQAIARHEIKCTFEDVAKATAYVLAPGGKIFLVHRPFRIPEIITSLKNHGLEPKRMQLVYPFVDKEPNMVLLEAVKGGKARMKVEKPLIIYKKQGEYTDEIYDIYGY
jgi:tRNA1Val (adenine37-N6)-methyltransferase